MFIGFEAQHFLKSILGVTSKFQQSLNFSLFVTKKIIFIIFNTTKKCFYIHSL